MYPNLNSASRVPQGYQGAAAPMNFPQGGVIQPSGVDRVFHGGPGSGHSFHSKTKSWRDPHAQQPVQQANVPSTSVRMVDEGVVPNDIAPLPGTEVETYQTTTTTTTRLVEDYHDRDKQAAPVYYPGMLSTNSRAAQPAPWNNSQSTWNSTGWGAAAPSTGFAGARGQPATGFQQGQAAQTQTFIVHEHRPDGNPLVEVVACAAKGEMPHNLQAAQVIDKALATLEWQRLNDPSLNHRGQRIARHSEDLLDAIRTFLYEKNSDELLQKIIRESASTSGGLFSAVSGAGVNAAPLKNQANEAAFLARNLFTQVLRSQDFRLLLIDTVDLLSTIFSGNMQGKPQQLKSILTQGIQRGDNMRSIKSNVMNMFKNKTQSPLSSLSSNIFGQQQQQQSGVLQQTAAESYVQQPITLTSQIRVISEDPNARVEVVDMPTEGLQQQWSSYDSSSVIPPAMSSAPQQGLTDQQKREFSLKLRQLLIRYGQREDFRRAGSSIFRLFKLLSQSGRQIKSTGGVGAPASSALWIDLQNFIERFTGGKSIRPLIKNFRKLAFMIRHDDASMTWFRDFKTYAQTTWTDPRTLEDESRVQAMTQLIDRGRILYNSPQYRKYTTAINWELKELMSRLRNDRNGKALAACMGKLSQDLFYDVKGSFNPNVLRESIPQLRLLLIPGLINQLSGVNLPRVESYSPKIDFAVSNVIFNANDILPEHIRLTLENDFDLNLLQLGTDFTRHKMILSVHNIRTFFSDVMFAYRKKTFPRLSDEGVLDLGMLGAGMSILVEWKVESGAGMPTRFYCHKASCVIDDLTINIKTAKHRFLDRLAVGMIRNTVRTRMEKTIADKLLDFGQTVADGINEYLRRREMGRNKIRGYSSGLAGGFQGPAVTAVPTKDIKTTTVTQTTVRNV